MQERKNISSGGPWVCVSGTTAMTPQGLVGRGNAYEQTRQSFRTIEGALKEAGAAMSQVIRTRMFVTNMNLWEEVGRAHGEVFGEIRPAATMVEVSRLIDPEMLIEIETDAYVPEASSGPQELKEDKQ